MKALARNILVHSPIYAKVLHQYNQKLQEEGKVNDKKFYETIILPELPKYSLQSWYQFLKRFRGEVGLIAAETESKVTPAYMNKEGENKLVKTMLTNQEATAKLISNVLNISASAALDIVNNPELLTPEKRIELGLKVMKAQDSRIHAVGKLREDSREQEKFDRTFNEAQF